jgi:hypothetical protein
MRGGDLVERIAPMLKDGGEILIVTYNRRAKDVGGFGASINSLAPGMVRPALPLIEAHYVPASRARWWLQRHMIDLGRMAHARPLIGIPLIGIAGGFFALGTLLANAATMRRTTARLRPGRIATSFALRLRVDAAMAKTAGVYSAGRIERQRRLARLGLPAAPASAKAWHWQPGQLPYLADQASSEAPQASAEAPVSTDPREVTREPQYMDCLAVRDRYGMTQLGVMTNQVWHDDPRRVTFILARYKFVAKMLSGRRRVAEVGCGDAFGARIVLQEAQCVDVYDFDPIFIDDIRQRQSPEWPLSAAVHDIVLAPLPHRYEGIFSLDVIEHINAADEPAYLGNLCGSLNDDGVLIIGSPSLESQQYGSPQSKIGHINCKSGLAFKALMEHYFHNVFVFSMNDEVVHTGFYPMAHYLIAVCCGKKATADKKRLDAEGTAEKSPQ